MDRFSFDDSDRFEEDSMCSWSSEPESLCNNWRGWKRPITTSAFGGGPSKKSPEAQAVVPLTELAARCVASYIPFELVEHVFPPVPEQLQLRIAYWSFPDNEEDIRLYSCLANSSADEFHRGELLFKTRSVKEPLQIGFHLSASVVGPQPRTQFNVAVTFDRRRIASCNCTCPSAVYWCSHVVAVCLHRIHCPHEVCLRAPVSESLTRLQRDQLQKFAQYLISELPQQILPTAQRLLDELLSSQPTAINTVCGAPDPTAGASLNDLTNWYLDEKTLHDNIKKILIKFCLPSPMVFSDVNYLTNSAPPAAAEWSSLLRPLRGREPEGMWNLLSIVREMYRRCDRNAVRLLEIITEECMACDQILVWWFNTKLSLLIGTGGYNGGKHNNTHSNSNASQHACSSLCDEIVILWRLASLNPSLAPDERDMLHAQFTSWHLKILDRLTKSRVANPSHSSKQQQNIRTGTELFIGFKPAIEACYLDWEDYPIPGITHTQDKNPMYHSPFTCFKHADSKSDVNSHVNSTQAIINANVKLYCHPDYMDRSSLSSSNNSNISNISHSSSSSESVVHNDGNRSSASSEGFCENDDDGVEASNVVEESRPGVTTVTTVTTKSSSLKIGKSTVQQQTKAKIKIPEKEPIGLLRRKHDIVRQESSSGASNTSNSSSSSITNVLKYTKCRNDTSKNNINSAVCVSDNSKKITTNDCSNDNNCNSDINKNTKNSTNTLINKTIIDINKCFISNNNSNNNNTKSKELLHGKSGSTCSSSSIDSRNSSNIQILPGCSSSILKSANNMNNTNNINSVTNKIKVNKNINNAAVGNFNSINNSNNNGDLLVPKVNGLISDTNVSSPSSFYSTNSKDSKSPAALSSSSSSTSSLCKNTTSTSSGHVDDLHQENEKKLPTISIENILTKSDIPISESIQTSTIDVTTITTTVTTSVTAINKDIATRRPSKDDSVSSAESQQSYEDFKMCYYGKKPPQKPSATVVLTEESPALKNMRSRYPATLSEIQRKKFMEDIQKISTTDFQMLELPQQSQTSQYHYPPQPIHHNVNTTHSYTNDQTYRNGNSDPNSSKAQIFSNVKPTEDAWDILFARAEGLHAHGHGREACILAVRLAEEMLANPPNLMVELPIPPRRKGKKNNINPISHQITLLASGTLAKSAFLCTVLAENSEHYHLAFKICMYGLQMPRLPASTKPLEVKLANQEADLLVLLKRIPLGLLELKMIRELAELLRDGTLRSRGEALLPIMLASFIFEALVMPSVSGKETRTKIMSISYRMPVDENLGFEAAVAALGLKANVSEADHPLLCEGTRRQRGDLALTLLYYYKDEPRKIAKIMDKLLDREIHTLIKTPLLSSYYSSNAPIRTPSSRARREEQELLQFNDALQNEYNSNNVGNVASGNSRPHSSTSAEHENCFNVMNLSSQNNMAISNNPPQPLTPSLSVTTQVTRIKDSRYKGKRAYPSIPNQPSEASAHFMFELAKIVLTKAGGTSSTSLFTQATTNQNHHGPHRALHMCAFQLGVYALGLHNCVSPNWLSRTYSSHVSWIMGQAMEIGAPGISFLIDTWEGHLTPPEAAGMADRASRGWDSNMIYPAAELALSVLPHAAALNPNEIQRAILQCKEQSDQMLERACITVENAAKGGGVYPEVLFQVARYWYELYLRNTPGGEGALDNDFHIDHNVNLGQIIESQEISQQNAGVALSNQSVVVTSTPPQPYQTGPIGITHYEQYNFPNDRLFPNCIPVPPIYPFPPPPKSHTFTFQQLQYEHMMNPDFSKLASYPPMKYYPNTQPYSTLQGSVQVPVAPPSGQMQPTMQFFNPPPNNMRSQTTHHGLVYPFVPPPPVRQRHPHQFSPTQLRYLLAAYNVGMLAMETLARRVHDDRPQAKYARNPPYGEDVKWLLQISKKLGTQYLHQFCVCAVNSIVSPFVLHDVAIESAQYLGRNNPAIVLQHLRSALTPLVQKCQQMYIQCIHQKLYHLTVADYEDFSNIIIAARAAFIITPEGNAQFKDWLQSIKRSKSCKKDLWAQITTALQTNSK